MDKLTFVIAIVAIVMGAGVIRQWLISQTKTQKKPSDLDQRLKKIEELEERVQVLEKIVTDKHYDLNQQFRDLGA